jgi:hypothetical protein
MEIEDALVHPSTLTTHGNSHRASCFECEPSEINSILGLKTLGDMHLRFDASTSQSPHTISESNSKNRLVPTDEDFQTDLLRDRLARLMARQQRLYEAELEQAKAAEQLVRLWEHHQGVLETS